MNIEKLLVERNLSSNLEIKQDKPLNKKEEKTTQVVNELKRNFDTFNTNTTNSNKNQKKVIIPVYKEITLESGVIIKGDTINEKDMENGTIVFPSQDTYFGPIKNLRPYGKGILFRLGKYTHEGVFNVLSEDNYEGKMTWINGYSYTGSFNRNHEMDGHGTWTWPNGASFEGNFTKGFWNDQEGKLTLKTGEIITGNFTNGTIKVKDGEYTGDLIDNTPYGLGKITLSSGTIYDGGIKNGVADGQGKMTWSNGMTYEGEFVNGMQEGQGKLDWPNGNSYVGSFKNGKKHGRGSELRPANILGVYSIYEGEFFKNKRHGVGILTNYTLSSSTKVKVIFDHGKLIKMEIEKD